MGEHTCHAQGCTVAVPRRVFMCRRHWFALPKPMRDAVLGAYRIGQTDGRIRPSREYLEAARVAVAYLATQHPDNTLKSAQQLGDTQDMSDAHRSA